MAKRRDPNRAYIAAQKRVQLRAATKVMVPATNAPSRLERVERNELQKQWNSHSHLDRVITQKDFIPRGRRPLLDG